MIEGLCCIWCGGELNPGGFGVHCGKDGCNASGPDTPTSTEDIAAYKALSDVLRAAKAVATQMVHKSRPQDYVISVSGDKMNALVSAFWELDKIKERLNAD